MKLGPPSSHWFGNVLEDLRPKILAGNFDLAPDLPIGVVRNADTTRFGDPFKAGSDIDAITKDVVFVDDDIADMDADPKLDPDVDGCVGILVGHAALNFNRTAYSVHRTGELYQHAVASRLDDPTSMGGYTGVNKALSNGL